MAFRALPSLALAAVTLLSGCSMFRSYDTELQATNQQLATGNVDAALTLLEKNNTGEDKDLLYFFEKGELLRAKGDLTGSQTAWRSADLQVFKWEESVKFDSAKYLAQFGSFDEAVAHVERYPSQLITPFVTEEDGQRWLRIPADAGYPVTGEMLESAARG